ncbi:MAG: molybdopterin-dependent oxidoreductase [Mycobacteriaceae bacterium]
MNTRTSPVMSVPAAALSGVLAVLAALGAAHLVAGYVDPQSSPYLAVGNSAIDRTPPWLKDFGISAFGSNDKLVLLLVMGLVMVIFGASAGVLCRRSRAAGAGFIVLLGIVGTFAALGRPDTETIGVLAPLSAIPVGVAVLMLLVHRATPEAVGEHVSRRSFLGTSAAVAVGAGLSAVVGQRARNSVDVAASRTAVGTVTPTNPLSPPAPGADFVADGSPSFITGNADFYRVDTSFAPPRIRAEDWSLRIHGMVDKEITLDFAQLVERPLVAQRVTFTCVSYEVGGDLVSTADWVGVPLRDLLLEAGVRSAAEQIYSTSSDGFTASTPVDVVMQPGRGAMLAVNMNGQPLPVEHGFPVRMLVPGLYGYVSATKWITDIELTTYAAARAYWTPRGWSDHGPIKIASKITAARRSVGASRNTVTVTGVAWYQSIGISAVEIRVDGGGWQNARLGADGGKDAWRMWRADAADVGGGSHTVECRATGTDGTMQTEKMAPPAPDGATGWHTFAFTV